MDSLTQNLAEKEGKRGGKNNKAFLLAHWDEIKKALSAGWNMKAIWDYLHSKGNFPGGYNTFVRCVRMEQAQNPLPALKSTKAIHSPAPPTQTSKSTHTANEGFVFSPDADTDSLI